MNDSTNEYEDSPFDFEISTIIPINNNGKSIQINNITICLTSDTFQSFQYIMDDLLLGASIGATVFNILVLVVAFKLFKRSGDTMHLFIINMTLGDFLLTIFCHPNEFLSRKHDKLKIKLLCTIIHYFNWTGLAVSGLSLTMLNIDKLIYFKWPLAYDTTMSKKRAGVICVMIWIVSMGYCAYIYAFKKVIVTKECMLNLTDMSEFYYEFFMLVFCILPVTSSLIVSIYLFRLTRQKRCSPMGVAANVDAPTFKHKAKSLVFIFATTAWTSFSLLPYRVFNISRKHFFEWSELSCDVRETVNWLAWFLVYLLTANPIVNPLITAIIYAPYRRAIKRFLFQFPGSNKFQYTSYRAENTDTSFLSFRRSRNRFSGSMDNDNSSGTKKSQNNNDVRVSLNSFDTSSGGNKSLDDGGQGQKLMMTHLSNKHINIKDRSSLVVNSIISRNDGINKDKPFRSSTSAYYLQQQVQTSSRPNSQNNESTLTDEKQTQL
uniref:G_PROTEIN_RECEP_F1_2 domain-containing protein n=1 Tax=Parastrongyloides trichosuri TaxID=131310 RepID=A0A0N4ZRV4_PARTI